MLGLMITVLPSVVFADAIADGKKIPESCFKVENVADFPDYVFLAYYSPNESGPNEPTLTVMTPNKCISAYIFPAPTLYALTQEDYAAADLSDPASLVEQEDVLIKATTGLPSGRGQIDEDDPRERIIYVYTIKEVNDQGITLEQSDELGFDSDGKPIKGASPSPSSIASPRSQTVSAKGVRWIEDNWSVALPVAGSIIIGLIIVINIARKRPTEVVIEQPPDEQQ